MIRLKSLFLFNVLLFCCFIGFSQENSSITDLESQVATFEKAGNSMELARCQVKLGFLYKDENNLSKSTENFQKAIKTNEVIGNLNAIKNLCVNIGMNYIETENYEQALVYFKKSLAINEKQGKKADIVSDLINIAETEQSLKNYTESNENLDKASSLAKELSDMVALVNCYATMAENYEKLNMPDKSKEYFEQASTIKSHLQKEELTKFESRTKQAESEVSQKNMEIQSKENKIQKISREQQLTLDSLVQQKELTIAKDKQFQAEENLHRIQQKNTVLIIASLLVILLLVIISLAFIFKQLRDKKKANNLLEISNQQILEQKKEIEIQRDIATAQKKKITDSIIYAQRIQNAVLPPMSIIEKALPEHFILYKPRDIVSGDFYWMTEKENFVVIAVVDCTGHGVPGAFMSMLGVAFLNDIINKTTFNRHFRTLTANEILNQLRDYVIDSLHQSDSASENKDGMDISLIILDFEKLHMQFAGAHNPVYIIRNNEMIQLAGDPMPIGIYETSDASFTNHEIDLEEDDLVYLFSDGYYDQFSGAKGIKMMSANFRKYLMEIHQKPLTEQKELLETYFNTWKGKRDQMDDVTILGFKFQPSYKISTVPQFKLWHDKRILIAEDVQINFLLLVEALKHTKATIFRVENGRDAVTFCVNNELDLVLMDIHMPIMNGIEAIKLIKGYKPELPIIAQTAVGNDEDIEKVKLAGCDDIIIKPIDLKIFLSTVRKFLIK